MHRQLGISSAMLGQQLTRENLAAAAAAGVEVLEVYVPAGGELYEQDAAVECLGEMTHEMGLGVWSVHAPFGGDVDLSSLDELQRRASVDAAARAAAVARVLGARFVVVHAGLSAEDGEERQLRWRESLRSINSLIKRCAQLGVRVTIEYLPANKLRLCNDSGHILEFLSVCDGDPGICLDTNHANLAEPLAQAVRTLGSRIETLHISDNDGEQERHEMPGNGVIDWAEFVALLDEIGYTGPLMYETGGAENVAELMATTAANAREYFGWEGPAGE